MKLHSYLDQLITYAEEADVELSEITKQIGYQSNWSRWQRNLSSPRLAQARRVWDAITQRSRLR